MHANKKLRQLNTPNVKKVKRGCLTRNTALKTLNLPEAEVLGDYCFSSAYLMDINMPKVRKIGNMSLMYPVATELKLPCLEKMGDSVFANSCDLKKFEAPNLTVIGEDVLRWNEEIKSLELPKLQTVGDGFLEENNSLERLVVPKKVVLDKKWKKIREEPSVEKNKDLAIESDFQEQMDGIARTRSASGIRRIVTYIAERLRGAKITDKPDKQER